MKVDIEIVNNTVELYTNELKNLKANFEEHMLDLNYSDTEYKVFNGAVLGLNWGLEALNSIEELVTAAGERDED